jgi:hypothetical protein
LIGFFTPTRIQGASQMTSTLGAEDESHDFPSDEKDKLERKLRMEGDELSKKGKPKERQ